MANIFQVFHFFAIYDLFTSVTRTTRMRHEQHKCYTNNTSATRVLRERHQCDMSENIFSHSRISYMANERLQGEEQFHSKICLLEMRRSHDKMRLKSAPQKLNFVMAKSISKCSTLHCSCKCSCTFPHSYAQQNSLVFDKSYFMWN